MFFKVTSVASQRLLAFSCVQATKPALSARHPSRRKLRQMADGFEMK
jgi:hypothetical protein